MLNVQQQERSTTGCRCKRSVRCVCRSYAKSSNIASRRDAPKVSLCNTLSVAGTVADQIGFLLCMQRASQGPDAGTALIPGPCTMSNTVMSNTYWSFAWTLAFQAHFCKQNLASRLSGVWDSCNSAITAGKLFPSLRAGIYRITNSLTIHVQDYTGLHGVYKNCYANACFVTISPCQEPTVQMCITVTTPNQGNCKLLKVMDTHETHLLFTLQNNLTTN